jgi:hypothetical protein
MVALVLSLVRWPVHAVHPCSNVYFTSKSEVLVGRLFRGSLGSRMFQPTLLSVVPDRTAARPATMVNRITETLTAITHYQKL